MGAGGMTAVSIASEALASLPAAVPHAVKMECMCLCLLNVQLATCPRFICCPPLLQVPFEDQDECIHSELECLFFHECTEVQCKLCQS